MLSTQLTGVVFNKTALQHFWDMVMINTILIVDDEPRLLKSIDAGLREHQDRIKVITALNGREAVHLLESAQVDLVVTDLKMPEMDGFELLAHISSHYPSLPAIVMTAFSTPEIEEQIKDSSSLKLLEKPIDFDELADSIFEGLQKSRNEGSLTGISLPSFLQLIETEQKTCIIEVSKEQSKGFIYFNQGELYSAVYNNFSGEEAIFGMLLLEDVVIRIKKHVKRKYKKIVTTPLLALLVEGAQRKDEMLSELENRAPPSLLNENQDEEDKSETFQSDHNNSTEQGDYTMSELKDSLARLSDVEGFMAVGIFSPNGEMASELNTSGVKLAELGSLANDVLLKAQKATDMMDVGRGQVVHIDAPKAQIIARCLNENTDFSATEAGKAHLHMVLILSKDGNLAMAKMKLESVIQECAAAFR